MIVMLMVRYSYKPLKLFQDLVMYSHEYEFGYYKLQPLKLILIYLTAIFHFNPYYLTPP